MSLVSTTKSRAAPAVARSLIKEVEAAFSQGSPERRSEMLRQVTDLFLDEAESYSDEHVAVFDDVMVRLIDTVERYALIQLSRRLAPIDNAPINVIHHLGCSDDIEIAGPVIERSSRLSEELLVEIAQTMSQAHLAALAARSHLSQVVTDSLVPRANMEVTRKVAANNGACFSDASFRTIAGRGCGDANLAEIIAGRSDLPSNIFGEMLQNATEIVRQRLSKSSNPAIRRRIEDVVSSIGTKVQEKLQGHSAAVRIEPVQPRTRLCEQAKLGQRGPTIETLASITEIPSKSIKNLIRLDSEEGILILCKVAGLGWADAKNVLVALTGTISDHRKLFDTYIGLTSDMARRVVRFIKMRRTLNKSEIAQQI